MEKRWFVTASFIKDESELTYKRLIRQLGLGVNKKEKNEKKLKEKENNNGKSKPNNISFMRPPATLPRDP